MSKQQHFGTLLLYCAFEKSHEEDNELGEYHCRGAVRQGCTNTIAERQEAENYGRDNEIRVRRRVLLSMQHMATMMPRYHVNNSHAVGRFV